MKKKNNFGKKVIALLITLSLVMSAGTFAYWANYVEGTSTEATGTLEIGSGDIVETRFDLTNELNSGGLLVPENQAVNSGEEAVEEIHISYDISWNEDEAQTQLDGTYTVGDIQVAHEVEIELDGEILDPEVYSNIYALVHVSHSESNPTQMILDATAETFSFTVTMDEPANQEEYNLISTAKISVTFSYEINESGIVVTDGEMPSNEPKIVGYFTIGGVEYPIYEGGYEVFTPES